MRKVLLVVLCVVLLCLSMGRTAFAHEVYVLDQSEINFALHTPPPDFVSEIGAHSGQFVSWGLLAIAVIIVVFFLSVSRPLERVLDPTLEKIKRYAPHIAQATIGLALVASGYYHALFGVELPLLAVFGSFESIASHILVVLGVMLFFGIFPRVAAIVTAGIFIGFVSYFGIYMLNYFTYFGEALTIAIFGSSHKLFDVPGIRNMFSGVISERYHDYKFLIIRVMFGISLIYASLYAKFIHGALALEVVTKYNLTHYFPFDPIFLVLGAMLTEVGIGICFIIGFEIRFISLFFLVFLSLSLVFFGEAVWPHIILIGTAIGMFAHGYDRYTFSMKLNRNRPFEPVL